MQYDESLLDVVRQALTLALKIIAPILGAGIAIGLTVSIVQSITSIQEQTLTFVPKIFIMIIVAILLMAWIVERIATFTVEMFTVSPYAIGWLT